jgi:phage tail sheath protein FI
MSNQRAPGVNITERDISEVLVPAGTSVGALVGAAYQGLTNQRVLITNDKEFVQMFGSPLTGAASEFPYYTALEFLKESGFLWYTRVTASTDKVGIVKITSAGATTANTEDELSTTSLLAVTGYEDGNTPTHYETIDKATSPGPLIIGSIGPGAYSADIGITVVGEGDTATSAVEYNGYGYNWAGKYPTGNDLYRINVYSKDSRDTTSEAGWDAGSGITPLKSVRPVESFIVSNNTEAKDSEQNSMYVKDVINGNSNYIYVHTNGTAMGSSLWTSGKKITALGTGVSTITADPTKGWDFYESKEAVDVNLLLAPYENASYSDTAAGVASTRRDCMAICQVGDADATVATGITLSTAKSTSYVASYAGGQYVYDPYTKKNITLPIATFAAKAYAFTDNVANVWNAPAGLTRGGVSGLGPYKAWNESEIGFMYNNNVNASKSIRGAGQYIWGQKTGQKKATALDRVNVRRLLLFIENSVEPLLEGYLFEQNTDAVRSRVVSNIDSFLQTIFAGGGLTKFSTICDETNNTPQVIDNNELAVDIYVQPSKTIEFINLQVTITRTGVNFSEIA